MRRTQDAWTPFSTLHGFICLILLVDWDPIGVFGYADAMDEYDGYAAEVCRLLRSGVSREALASHLEGIERHRMGARGELTGQTEVAEKLLLLYRTVLNDEQ